MSKAFVRESDFEELPELPPPSSALPPGAKNYMTAGGAQRLLEELNRLVDKERPGVAASAAHDIDAKRELQSLDVRIRHLQNSLRTAEIVTPSAKADVVRFGTTVTVREDDGPETHYRLVGVDETDLDRNWVSWLSPIARALMNGKPGQRVTFKAPRGQKELEILRIEYEPDR
jgi:transcription elongation factor GreB